MNKNYLKRIISILLCIALIGTSISFDREVKAVNVEQAKVEKNDLSKNTMLDNPFIEDTVVFAATYIEELDAIKGIWDFPDLVLTEIYIRRDNLRQFELFTTTQEKYIDISVDSFNEYCDIRIVVATEDGNKVTSELVTFSRLDETYDLVIRDSDGDHLPDGYEVWDIGTDPFNSDSDGDGFSDGYEINVLFTDPIVKTKDKDSDGDGFLDSVEMLYGTNPYLSDSDFDGESDALDTEPSITNFKSNKSVKYDAKLVTGKYDKSYEFTNADNDLCTIIINTLTKNVKYYKIGDTSESYFYYNIDNQVTAQINNTNGRLSADTYAYKDNKMIFIGHEGVAYKFDYNDTGDLIETKVGDQVIANHEYINSSPIQTVFANDQSLSYEYDENYEHITEISVNGDLYYKNIYDSNGNIVNQNDKKNDVSYQYEYDDYDRLISAKGDNGFEIEYSSDDDDYDRFTSYTYDGIVKEESLEYQDDKTVTNLINGGKISIPVFDGGDTKSVILYNDKNDIIYKDVIEKENNKVNISSNNGSEQTYEFDTNGNVTKIFKDNKEVASFKYDSHNRLVRSNLLILNETILYEYDNNNNIVVEKHYKYTEEDVPVELIIRNNYQYMDNNWKDLLTSYNGQDITYDEIGNPLQYLNGMNFTWDSGRQLSEISIDENQIYYSYNSMGLRTKKIVNGETTNYLLDGTKIIAEETEGNTIWYSYDSNDYVVGFEYNNEKFYYGKNIHNDITSIYDNNGNVVVEYLYDDWGNIVSISGNQEIGNLNNFRYRSYYYDKESGFYYLQSRYYDSEIGRFLNADEKLATFNAFSYCENNPINYVDYNGQEATIPYIIISLVFVGFLLLMVFLQGNNYFQMWSEYFASSISQFVGALASLGSYITTTIKQSVWNQANDVSLYIATQIRAYTQAPSFNSEYQVHHIVAERHTAATPARTILSYVEIDVNDYPNLVAIKTGVHVHLHTSLYFAMVNTYIINAYYAGSSSDKYYNVLLALREIKVFLYALSEGSPF